MNPPTEAAQINEGILRHGPEDPDHRISWPNANQEAETHRTYEEKLAYLHRESARLADENRQLMAELEARMNAEIISGWRATKAELEQAAAKQTTYPQPSSSGSNQVAGGLIDAMAAKGIQRKAVTGGRATDQCQATKTKTNARVSAEPGRPNGSALQRFNAIATACNHLPKRQAQAAFTYFNAAIGVLIAEKRAITPTRLTEALSEAHWASRALANAFEVIEEASQ